MFHRDDRTNAVRRFCAWCVLVVFALHLPGAPAAIAAPTGENVVHGEATFSRDGNETLIETGTDETIIDYDGFDILADEVVRIDQPHSDSRTLNRVPFGDPSQIDGSLLSNGIVYILNPAGVFVGDTAIIDVNGLVAAAGNLSNEDFLAGNDLFALSGDVLVADGAQISATDSVALLGRRVANFGTIQAQGGYVAFVAGDQAVLGKLDGHLIIRVDGGDPELDDFALTQAGEISGPRVSLAAGDTYSLAMNHTGVSRGRDIELRAGNEGLVQVAGELDASAQAPGETGGRIHVLGDKIALLTATLDASGSEGGGEIRVGGDVRGEGDLPTARRLYIAPDAVLRADAIERGDGGSIVAWSEEKTGFYGTASATGGSESGDGGFIEISGRKSLEARGHTVDLTAANGSSGTLLYDPERIEIRGGGPMDGSDAGDADDALEGETGQLGQILDGDAGEAGEEPFIIYESEIENTDADIELRATTQIVVSGDFDHQVEGEGEDIVVIKSGNDLTIRTTEDADPDDDYQIDLAADGNEGLRWVVSDGGTILILTDSGSNDGAGIYGHIRIGSLEFAGREFDDPLSPGILSSVPTQRSPIGVTTTQGNVTVVGDLIADGADSSFSEEGSVPMFRSAESGGNISIATQVGSITIAPSASISSQGGDAVAESPSPGGGGGFVLLSSNNGNVNVLGDIDVSGGDGLSGKLEAEEGAVFVPGIGGRGGAILLRGQGLDELRSVQVSADLTARGGNATGYFFNDAIGGLSFSSGGQGGQLSIDAGNVQIANSVIDMSGGHGPVEGGSAVSGSPEQVLPQFITQTPGQFVGREGGASLAPQAVAIIATGTAGTVGNVSFDNVSIDASGGAAGTETDPNDPDSTIAAGPGGRGGSGGEVIIDAEVGSVFGSTLTITNDGGAGSSAGIGPAAQVGTGGGSRTVLVLAEDQIVLGDISARGGDGDEGGGGVGGPVTISTGDTLMMDEGTGNITLAGIDTSGGNASSTLAEPVDFDGGAAGTINISALAVTEVAASEIALGGGIGGLGGVASGEDGVDGSGASVTITSTGGNIGMAAGASPDAGVASPVAAITAVTVGADGNPLRISGTPGEEDRATINVSGEAFVDVVNGIVAGTTPIAGELETLRLEQTALGVGVDAMFTQGAGNTLIHVMGRDPGDPVATGPLVLTMQSDGADEPRLEYHLEQEAPVEIALGAGDLGARGGSVTSLGAIVGTSGPGIHVKSDGNFTLGGTTIGTMDDRIVLAGDEMNAALRFQADGDVYADIDTEDGLGSFGAYAIEQTDAEGVVSVTGEETIEIAPVAGFDPEAPESEIVDVDTLASFSYALVSEDAEGNPSGDSIRITKLHVGDDETDAARVFSPGGNITIAGAGEGLVIGDTAAIQLAGGHLTLESLTLGAGGSITGELLTDGLVHVDMGSSDAAELLLLSRGDVGTRDDPIVTRNIGQLAGRHVSGFHLENRYAGERLEISEIENFDAGTLGDDREGQVLAGVRADGTLEGDIVITNDEDTVGPNATIVLGDLERVTAGEGSVHLASAGNVELDAPNIEVSNARFYITTDADGEDVVERSNDARIFAAGDIVLAGTVDTDANGLATDDREPPDDTLAAEFVKAELLLSSTGGVTHFEGDVGTKSALARLDTTDAAVPEARTFFAEETIFRGSLTGPGSATVRDEGGAASRVAFGGDVGIGGALAGLTVDADQIDFAVENADGSTSSANFVVVDGAIDLDTGRTDIPTAATITDTLDGLRMQATGAITVGALDKIAVTGDLSLTSGTLVRVSDLSANSININAPEIEIMTREAGAIELRDGSTEGMDAGVDFVANQIILSSSPTVLAGGATPTFYLGDGGVSLPGGLDGIALRRLNGKLSAVGPDLFEGQDGRVLDLTGSGPQLIADATSHMPRSEPLVLPSGPPEMGADAPVAAPLLAAPAVLAFLRCGGPELGTACASDDEAALQSLTAFDRSGLATARALEVTERYRELVAAPGAAERLRANFEEAGRAYAAATGWSEGEAIDGTVFYAFLDQVKLPALDAVRELSWLFTQIQLLGMSEGDTRRLQSGLADEFAAAAALSGFTGASALAAVEASPIGLPRTARR
jgi:filamentous hemagglutinin family protein